MKSYKDLLPVLAVFFVVVFVGSGEAASKVRDKSSKGDPKLNKTKLKTSGGEKPIAGFTQGFCGKYNWTSKYEISDGSNNPHDDYRVEHRAGTKRISFAREAEQKQFPSFALLDFVDENKPEPANEGRCGATIVGRDLIVTSARCAREDIKELNVRAGLNWDGRLDAGQEGAYYDKMLKAYNDTVQKTVVSKRCIHKKYSSDKNYDVAVLKTRDLFEWTEYVQPACLMLDKKPNRYGYYMVGFGRHVNHVLAPKLRYAPVQKQGSYLEKPAQWPQTVFGAFDSPHTGFWPTLICEGDEGGPVYTIRKNVQSLVAVVNKMYEPDPAPGCVSPVKTVIPIYFYDVYKDQEALKALIEECSK